MSNVVYRVIDIRDNTVHQERDAYRLSIWFWGRYIRNYIVVKSDGAKDQVVKLDNPNITIIQKVLEEA